MNNLKYNGNKEKAAGSQHIIFSDVTRGLRSKGIFQGIREEISMGILKQKRQRVFHKVRKRMVAFAMSGIMAGSTLGGLIPVSAHEAVDETYDYEEVQIATGNDAIETQAGEEEVPVVYASGSVISLDQLPLTKFDYKGYCFVVNGKNVGSYNDTILTGKFTTKDNVEACKKGIIIDGTTVNLTIRDVTINRSRTDDKRSNDWDYAGITLQNGATLNLTLEGSSYVEGGTGGAGIEVNEGCTLNITAKSTGSLKAVGGDFHGGAAGIGAASTGRLHNNQGETKYGTEKSFGTIIIRGGTVEAIGGTYKWCGKTEESAAGIGGSGNGAKGKIEIRGGNVTATGGDGSAGIGGGCNGQVDSILITGGNVTATGNGKGAGIGAGWNGNTDGTGGCGDISIIGGNVKVNGNLGMGGIYNNNVKKTGSVSVTGGAVDVTGEINPATDIDKNHIVHHYSVGITIEDPALADGESTARVFLGQGSSAYIGTASMKVSDGKATGTFKADTTLNGTQDISLSLGQMTYEDKTINLDKDKSVSWGPVFRAVTDITLGRSAYGFGSHDLVSAVSVTPAYATNRTIVWSIEDKGITDANVKNDILTVSKPGTFKLKATIKNGAAADKDYTKTFTINNKQAGTITNLNIKDWTYGDKANAPTFATNNKQTEALIEYKVQEDDDDTYSTSVPTLAGEYTVRITLAETESYSEAVNEADFTINRKSLEAAGISGSCKDQYFTGFDITPGSAEIVLKDKEVKLAEGVDYVIDGYSNNRTVTTGQNQAEIKVSGAGNYTGTRTITFKIANKNITAEAKLSDYNWTSRPVKVSAPDGYRICRKQDAPYDYEKDFTDSFMVSEDDGTGEPVQISYYLMEIETGAVSEEKTIEVKIDTTAPELTGITWFSHKYDSLNVSIKSNETGSIEYVLVEDPGTENVTVVLEPGDTKSVPVESGIAANISFEGLEANKGYIILYCLRDRYGNSTEFADQKLKTSKIKISANGDIIISEVYGTSLEDCKISGSIIAESGEEVQGTFNLSQSEDDNKKQVYGCGDNGKLISVDFYPENEDYSSALNLKAKLNITKAVAPELSSEKSSYEYKNGSSQEKIDVAGLLPEDKGTSVYGVSVNDRNSILDNCKINSNGTLTYKVKKFTDKSMAGKEAVITVTVRMENYGDTEFKLYINLTTSADDDNKQPGGNNDQPGGNNDQPGGNNDQPGGNNDQPGGNNDQPGGNNDQPGGNNQKPGGNVKMPVGSTPQTGDNNKQKDSTEQQTEDSSEQVDDGKKVETSEQQTEGDTQELTDDNDGSEEIAASAPAENTKANEKTNYGLWISIIVVLVLLVAGTVVYLILEKKRRDNSRR